jgi:hypothetical protein
VIAAFVEAGTGRALDAGCLEAEILPTWALELP